MEGEAEASLSKDPSGAHYRQALGQSRAQHRLQKTTSFGVHKTRFLLTQPNGREWGVCSMGEQKGLLLSLALSLFRLCLNDQPDVVHFLLLDEGMTHLDEHRAAWLWDELLVLAGRDVGSGPGGASGMVAVTGTGGGGMLRRVLPTGKHPHLFRISFSLRTIRYSLDANGVLRGLSIFLIRSVFIHYITNVCNC